MSGKSICKWCERGEQPEFLDADGVKCSVSGNSGKLSHASGDQWWECPKWQASDISIVAVNVEDFKNDFIRRIAESGEWSVEDIFEKVGLEGKTETGYRLGYHGVDKIVGLAAEALDADWSDLQKFDAELSEIPDSPATVIDPQTGREGTPLSEWLDPVAFDEAWAKVKEAMELKEIKEKIREMPEDVLKENVGKLFEEAYGENPAPKPPVGALKRDAWLAARRQELATAIVNRINFEMIHPAHADIDLLLKWIGELQELVKTTDRPRIPGLVVTEAVSVPIGGFFGIGRAEDAPKMLCAKCSDYVSPARYEFSFGLCADCYGKIKKAEAEASSNESGGQETIPEIKNCAWCEYIFCNRKPTIANRAALKFCSDCHESAFSSRFPEKLSFNLAVNKSAGMKILDQEIECGGCRTNFKLSEPGANFLAKRCKKCVEEIKEKIEMKFKHNRSKSC